MIETSIQVVTVQVLHCVRAIRYQAKSEQNVRQDLTPRVRHGEVALMHPQKTISVRSSMGLSKTVLNSEVVLFFQVYFYVMNRPRN